MPTLAKDYTRLASIGKNTGATWVELPPGACPLYPDAPVIEGTLRDDQVNVPGNLPSERSDLQGATMFVPGNEYSFSWADCIVQLPDSGAADGDRWFYLGPEIHGRDLDQAPWALGITPDERRRLEVNPDGGSVNHQSIFPADVGVWHRFVAHIRYTGGADGFTRVWRDGVLVADYRGPVVKETGTGWFKLAMYRNRARTGTVRYRVCRMLIYAGLLNPADVFGSGDPGPAPLPPVDPAPTPAPSVHIISPQRAASITNTHVTITCQTQHAPPGATVYLGVAGGNHVQRPAADAVIATIPVDPGDRWIYAALHTAAGKVAGDNLPIVVHAPPPPPPPDPPAPAVDMQAVKQQLQAARAALNAAEQLLG